MPSPNLNLCNLPLGSSALPLQAEGASDISRSDRVTRLVPASIPAPLQLNSSAMPSSASVPSLLRLSDVISDVKTSTSGQVSRNTLTEWLDTDSAFDQLTQCEVLLRADLGKRLNERQPNPNTIAASDLVFPCIGNTTPLQILRQASELIHGFKVSGQGAVTLESSDAAGKTLQRIAEDAGLTDCANCLKALVGPKLIQVADLDEAPDAELNRLVVVLSSDNQHPLSVEYHNLQRELNNLNSMKEIAENNLHLGRPGAIEQMLSTERAGAEHNRRAENWRLEAIVSLTTLMESVVSATYF